MPKDLVNYFSILLLCLSGCSSSQIPPEQVASQEKSGGGKQETSLMATQARNVEAAAHYLDIICPANLKVNNQNAKDKLKEELFNRGELTDQDYGRFLDESLLSRAATSAKSAKAMTDPEFIWPENIRSLVAEMAAAEMEIASSSREFVRSGGYTEASQQNLPWPDWPGGDAVKKLQDKASAIRSTLRLPPRNEGCSNGQRALTTDQIQALQQN